MRIIFSTLLLAYLPSRSYPTFINVTKSNHDEISSLLPRNFNPSKTCYKIVQIADTQIGMYDRYGFYRDGKLIGDWKKELDRTYRALEHIQASNIDPEFVVITGDIINEFPGEKYNLQFRERQNYDMMTALNDPRFSNLTILVQPGNHDVGKSFTEEEIGPNYANFWGSNYYTLDDRNLSLNVGSQEENKNYTKYFFLDSNLMTNHNDDYEYLGDQHLDWFDQEIDKIINDDSDYQLSQIIIFTHHALCFQTCQDSWNQHIRSIKDKFKNRILASLRKVPADVHVFSGHYHKPDNFVEANGAHLVEQDTVHALSMNFKQFKFDPTVNRGLTFEDGGYNVLTVCNDERKVTHEMVDVEYFGGPYLWSEIACFCLEAILAVLVFGALVVGVYFCVKRGKTRIVEAEESQEKSSLNPDFQKVIVINNSN